MERLKFILFGITFLDTKKDFLKKISKNQLGYYCEDEVETDYFDFDYSANTYTASFDDDEWTIWGHGVESASELISEYDTKESYVLEERWFVGDDPATVIATCFLNCDCPDQLKKYYGNGLFIQGYDNKLVEVNSDYFKKISDEFNDGEGGNDSDVEAVEFYKWKENIDHYLPF